MQFTCFLFSLIGCLILSALICNILVDIFERRQRVKRTKQQQLFNKLITKLTQER